MRWNLVTVKEALFFFFIFDARFANIFRRLQAARACTVRAAAQSCSSSSFGGDRPS
ncbi:MAG: hypothetical protein LBD78_04935 [Spirochaetaceae bacterium]|nr:hypothetical protein [Spirochaetaceae bacterium]